MSRVWMAPVVFALAMTLAACGSDYEPTAEELDLLNDDRFGAETFESADYGGEIEIDADGDDLRIVPSGSGGDEANLWVTYEGPAVDSELSISQEVRQGSVLAIADYRIRVTTVDDRGVAVKWAKLSE